MVFLVCSCRSKSTVARGPLRSREMSLKRLGRSFFSMRSRLGMNRDTWNPAERPMKASRQGTLRSGSDK